MRRAQLVEVLDEGEPILVGDRPERGPSGGLSCGRGRPARPRRPARRGGFGGSIASRRCGSSSSSSWLSPLTEPRNSRIPLPRRAAQLRQAFRPEDDQGDDQDDRELEGSDVSASTHGNGREARSDHAEFGRLGYPVLGFLRLVAEKCGLSRSFRGFDSADMRDASRSQTKTSHRAPRLPASAARGWCSRPAGSRPATAATGASGGAAPSASGTATRSTASRDRRLRRGARPRHPGAERGAEGARAREHAVVADTFAAALARRPDHAPTTSA